MVRLRRAVPVVAAALVGGLGLAAGCGSGSAEGGPGTSAASAADPAARAPGDAAACPATHPAPAWIPGTKPEHETLAYWLEQTARGHDLDEVLLDREALVRHRRALERPWPGDERPLGQVDLRGPVDRDLLAVEARDRLTHLRRQLAAGELLLADGADASPALLARLDPGRPLPARLVPEVRLARETFSLRCGPFDEVLVRPPALDPAFDRNACSAVRAGEPVQVFGLVAGGHRLARTRYALGYVPPEAPLGPPLSPAEVDERAAPPTPEEPLTRRAVLATAFAHLGAPYGWGGRGGHQDCSRFVLDVFDRFGVGLPRNSQRQGLAGSFTVDLSDPELAAADKQRLLDAAQDRGVVIAQMPGHILLYLGRDAAGTPMGIHAFSEYAAPCPESAGETVYRADRVAVTTLALGAGTARGAFLERLTRLAVFAPSPGPALAGVATVRPTTPPPVPAADEGNGGDCRDTVDARIFRTPAMPNPEQPLTVVAALSADPGPVTMALYDPDGSRVPAASRRLGGPPWGVEASVPSPATGLWTAVVGDGDRVVACKRIRVLLRRPRPREVLETDGGEVWTPRWRWEADTENLYALFVERLFAYRPDRGDDLDRTWPSLQALLDEPDRNLLHDHLSQREEDDLELVPDCADLSYYLRGYFAWKLRLPFGYRRCTRGRGGRPPRCGDLLTNLAPRKGKDEIASASIFLRRDVKSAVHSASARTVPGDDDTDVYPVPLTRRHLPPGTVFADPYGHLLVLAQWIPQGPTGAGVLLGADAQPDGTVGRRRFWRGSFLFDPNTDQVGAGFHAWRPLVFDPRAREIAPLTNRELAREPGGPVVHPYDRAQYAGDREAFYAAVEALVSPRPLDPAARLDALVDAFAEQVARRVVSVANGEAFMASRGFAPIPMPEGSRIFLTSGPWEDYSTPSRDMRLLIALDAVTGFPDRVAAAPARFGIARGQAETVAAGLRDRLRDRLGQRDLAYRGSDGSTRSLTLGDVVARADALEMAYNPNDCIEVRWGAPRGTPEHATCERRAPAEQRARMRAYRPWFAERKRPPE